MYSRLARAALLFCLVAGLAAMFARPVTVFAQQERPPAPVTVVTLHKQAVTVTARLPGRVVASGVAEVRPQVAGIIIERLFEEGSRVKEGDVLYRIDPATYEAQVAAAEAAVSQAQVALDAATRDAERISALSSRNVVSAQSVDDAVSKRETAAAALQVAKAQLLAAEINLDRTAIKAQLTGSIGRTLTTQGALVTAGQAEPLSVIRQLDPVYVDVTQSAAELIRWRRNGARQEGNTTVRLTLADRQAYEHTGELTAAEPHVDEQTGVVLLRLQFPNPDELLLPGMYVQVELPQGVVEDIILAPQGAVSRDRRGNPVAMIVNAENKVEQRELTVLGDRGADWIVSGGLEEGDRLIVEGFQKIGVGASVQPEENAAEETQMEETQN